MRGEVYWTVSSLGLLATAVILVLHARFVYLTGKDLQKSCAKLDRALKRLDTKGGSGLGDTTHADTAPDPGPRSQGDAQ